MKKILFAVISVVIIGCTNPAMDEKLASLNEALAELAAQILAADIDTMISDLESITAQADQALADAENSKLIIAEALLTIENIKTNLASAQVHLDNAATTEQVDSLAAQVAEMTEGINILVFIADYDYDGVMNGFDQCPDTPFNEIIEVNGIGCSSTQTPTTSTTTTTTG